MKVEINKTVIVSRTFLPKAEICRDCERQFITSPQEIAKYTERKMDLPKRCRQCRQLAVIVQKLMDLKKMLATVLKPEEGHEPELPTQPESGDKA